MPWRAPRMRTRVAPWIPAMSHWRRTSCWQSVRITGLRDQPVEAQGIVLEVDPQPLGPILGIRFRTLLHGDLDFLRTFVERRSPDRSSGDPALLRPRPPYAPGVPESVVPAGGRGGSALHPAGSAPQTLPDPGAGHASGARSGRPCRPTWPPRGSPGCCPRGPSRNWPVLTRKSPPDAFLVDWPEAAACRSWTSCSSWAITPSLRPRGSSWPALHATTQLAREANRLGVSHLLVKPYALDDALVALLLQQLSGE